MWNLKKTNRKQKNTKLLEKEVGFLTRGRGTGGRCPKVQTSSYKPAEYYDVLGDMMIR